jgi:hypothetical protein
MPASFFDVDMDQLAGPVALVSDDWVGCGSVPGIEAARLT